jgi:hypothetical protein
MQIWALFYIQAGSVNTFKNPIHFCTETVLFGSGSYSVQTMQTMQHLSICVN